MNPSCDGKVRFESMQRAQETAHRQAHRHAKPYRAYHCRTCHGFHTGSADGKIRNEKRACQVKD